MIRITFDNTWPWLGLLLITPDQSLTLLQWCLRIYALTSFVMSALMMSSIDKSISVTSHVSGSDFKTDIINNDNEIHYDISTSSWSRIILYMCPFMTKSFHHAYTGLILGLHPANERWRYLKMTSLIGWVQALNWPCLHMIVAWYYLMKIYNVA